MKESSTFFAPMIYLKILAPAIEFYKKAFDAVELRRWTNDDGSVHVAEMSIHGALFHMHEESTRNVELSPQTVKAYYHCYWPIY
jgi:PhnB protein